MNVSEWFTTPEFWVGALWGFSAASVLVWHTLIRPMGRLLGFEHDRQPLPAECEQGHRAARILRRLGFRYAAAEHEQGHR